MFLSYIGILDELKFHGKFKQLYLLKFSFQKLHFPKINVTFEHLMVTFNLPLNNTHFAKQILITSWCNLTTSHLTRRFSSYPSDFNTDWDYLFLTGLSGKFGLISLPISYFLGGEKASDFPSHFWWHHALRYKLSTHIRSRNLRSWYFNLHVSWSEISDKKASLASNRAFWNDLWLHLSYGNAQILVGTMQTSKNIGGDVFLHAIFYLEITAFKTINMQHYNYTC